MTSNPGSSGARQLGGEFIRLGWMLFGFNGILVAAASIACYPTWTLGWRDAAFWGTVLAAALFRYLDVTRFAGQTAAGRPATMQHLRVYLIGLALVSTAAWVASQSVDL